MMPTYRYDLVEIGSGPAGEGAAMNAVKQGWRVAVVDERANGRRQLYPPRHDPLKGTCASLCRRMMQYNTMPMFRAVGEPRWFSFPEVMKAADDVITKQVAGAHQRVCAQQGTDLYTVAPSLPVRTEIAITDSGWKSDLYL